MNLLKTGFFVFLLFTSMIFFGFEYAYSAEPKIPSWMKNTALWWAQGKISDQEFFSGVQFLADKKILVIPIKDNSRDSLCGSGMEVNATHYQLTGKAFCVFSDNSKSKGIFPDSVEIHQRVVASWIKNTALGWSQDKITDNDLLWSFYYLVDEKIISLPHEYDDLPEQKISNILLNLPKNPNKVSSWTDIKKIDDFAVQGHYAMNNYILKFKIVDVNDREVARDGTISISILDSKKRILYLDTFSIRQADFKKILDTYTEEESFVYSWEVPVSEIQRGFGPFGTANIVFTDKAGNTYSNQFNSVSIPEFN